MPTCQTKTFQKSFWMELLCTTWEGGDFFSYFLVSSEMWEAQALLEREDSTQNSQLKCWCICSCLSTETRARAVTAATTKTLKSVSSKSSFTARQTQRCSHSQIIQNFSLGASSIRRELSATVLLIVVGWCSPSPLGTLLACRTQKDV